MTTDAPDPTRPTTDDTTTRRVLASLREAILDGDIAPGTRLRAAAIAERFEASRTPAREALVLLAQEGLVDLIPRRGAVVRPFEFGDVLDLYEVRALLEPYAARRAATRIDPAALDRMDAICREQDALTGDDAETIERHVALNGEFHALVVGAAGSTSLAASLASAEGVPLSFRRRFWRDEMFRAQSLFCHRELARALRSGESDMAESIMAMHIQGAIVYLQTMRDH